MGINSLTGFPRQNCPSRRSWKDGLSVPRTVFTLTSMQPAHSLVEGSRGLVEGLPGGSHGLVVGLPGGIPGLDIGLPGGSRDLIESLPSGNHSLVVVL